MTTREQWIKLGNRCENATGSDREIDADIFLARAPVDHNGTKAEWRMDGKVGNWAGLYTASLDAITVLIAETLPGWMCRLQWCGPRAEAWVAPDLNSPDCPQSYKDNLATWHDYCERNEVEVRPGSRESAIRALCAAYCYARAEIAGATEDEQKANAALIVRAVNSHADLVKALRTVRAQIAAADNSRDRRNAAGNLTDAALWLDKASGTIDAALAKMEVKE